jgi:hypothetical protein
MRQALRVRLLASATALRQVFGNPDLRRIQLAGAGSIIGSWSYTVALAVYAFESGGAAAVGLVALMRSSPPPTSPRARSRASACSSARPSAGSSSR